MVKPKCPACDKKIESKFNFCPYCSVPLKSKVIKNNFGMLGMNDSNDIIQNEIKLPFGMEKMVNSLAKQLEKQMGSLNFEGMEGMPRGIKIKIARGSPQMEQDIENKPKQIEEKLKVSEKELKRRINLPKVDAESKVKRLGNNIIYEIDAPGINKKEDVVLTELVSGLEIKAYSDNKCYIKFIPLKVEVVGYYIKKEKVFIELKG